MYGEEYCASVIGCMFSIFRCIVGECTTKGGRSLTMIFSDGFGVRFDVFYAGSMIVVLMGLFNIITAIFVEATLNGLKENETHRRYAKAYES
ncbi:HERC1, partial [Symbiodinium pilosum]